MLLKDKTAIVTGAGQGIGRAIALRLSAAGANVVLNDLDENALSEVTEAIKTHNNQICCVAGNITQQKTIDNIVLAATESLGGIDIIVNNAGYTWDGMLHRMEDTQWQAMLDVHLTAPFKLLRGASEYLRDTAKEEQRSGIQQMRKVVNISSINALCGNAGQANYAAAKAGVIGLTKSLAKEWGRFSVNVNCVAFGMIQTRLIQAVEGGEKVDVDIDGQQVKVGVPKEFIEAAAKRIPLGRTGTIEEAAGAVMFFCSPDSDYVTGEVLSCSGGLAF